LAQQDVMPKQAPKTLNISQLRARADLLRGAATRAGDPGMADMLLGKAAQLEADASLLEHGADKPTDQEIATRPPRRATDIKK
jgi:hypothetical protein